MKGELREHNRAVSMGKHSGTMNPEDVTDAVRQTFGDFARQVVDIRLGRVKDKQGNKISPRQISLVEAINKYYAIEAPETDMFGVKLSRKEKSLYILRSFFKQQDIYFGEDSLKTIAQRFGNDNLTKASVTSALISHSEMSSFDGTANTGDISVDWRFIIPEIILAAIRIDYEGASMHTNWIGSTINISQDEVKMPQILRGRTFPKKLGQGESIPFGSLKFGQKSAKVFKVGLGFEITEELLERSSIDMIFTFLGELGIDMAIGADVEAMEVLKNGEQANGSESAPVIGVDNTTNGFQYIDIKRGISRMQRLRRNVTRIITGEDDGLAITSLAKFEGFDGVTRLSNIQSILGVPETLVNDVYAMPEDQIMLLAPDMAMAKLQYRSMKVEQDRNIQNQTNRVFVSDYIGFVIIRRDARLIIDKSVSYASQGFPSYMDIDTRITQSMKYQNE